MNKNTVPFTKKDIKNYLDRTIKFWRDKYNNPDWSPPDDIHADNLIAPYYIDAFQSVRMTLFGESLPEDES